MSVVIAGMFLDDILTAAKTLSSYISIDVSVDQYSW